MGISRLTTRLQHKTERFSWPVIGTAAAGSKLAIVDGPGLAFYIFHLLVDELAGTSARVTLQIDYERVAARAVAWLDDLDARGFTIHKIYFDAALPLQKLPVRIERAARLALQASQLRARYEQKAKSREQDLASVRLMNAELWQDAQAPRPAFLVSCFIAGLRQSKHKATIELVPGEADHFCATCARELCQGSEEPYIFTNDSDLLVVDSGSRTKVVLLQSLRLTSTSGSNPTLDGRLLVPADLAKAITQPDLLELALIMRDDPQITFDVAMSKLGLGVTTTPEYTAFLDEVKGSTYDLASLTLSQRQRTQQYDPGFAEVICSIADPLGAPQKPTMFLPQLIEDATKATAWKPGANLRNLAYSVLLYDRQQTMVVEYDRRGEKSQPINISRLDDTEGSIDEHISWLEEQLRHIQGSDSSLRWRMLAMITVSSSLRVDSKPLPLQEDVATVLDKDRIKTWAQIHLAAQVDAVLYSLRLLKMSLDFVLAGAAEQNAAVKRMKALAATLGTLPDLPDLFASTAHTSQTEMLMPRMYVLEHSSRSARPAKRRKKAVSVSSVEPESRPDKTTKLASNPFAMLADSDL